MQRATSYGSKPGDNWQELLETLTSTTFFLVARSGPTAFNVRDEAGKIFKVTISNPHLCSCSRCSNSNLCIHLVFVLLKVLKIPQSHPLSYQTSLTDSEITLVLSGSCGGAPTGTRSTAALRTQSSNLSTKKVEQPGGLNDDGFVHRQELDEDGYIQCPICQDDMSKDQALTWCRKGCGNNIHAKCMQNYSQYKIGNKEAAGCPLCRVEWTLDLLKGDCRGQASLKHTCSPVYCTSCTFPQRMKFNRCVECSQTALSAVPPRKPIDFCARCFTSIGREHTNHHFLSSDASVTDFNDVFWVPVVNHRSQSHVMDRDTLTALQQRELSVGDYEALLDLDKVVPDLSTQLILSLDEVTSEGVHQKPQHGPLCWCRSKAATLEADKIRRLPCKHTCHESCLHKEVTQALSVSCNGLSALTCSHAECGGKVFPSLVRRRKRKVAAPDVSMPKRESSAITATATAAPNATSIAASISTMGVTGSGEGFGSRTKGILRTGSSLREGLSTCQSEHSVAVSLGIEGLGISGSGACTAKEAVSALHDKSPTSRRVVGLRNKVRESTSRLTTCSADDVDTAVTDGPDVPRIVVTSSSSAHFHMDLSEQLTPRDDPNPSAGKRRLRPPRPRPLPVLEGVLDISGLDIQGQRSISLGGTASRKDPSDPDPVPDPLGGTAERARSNSLRNEGDDKQARTRRRIELTRSAGSLRGISDMDGSTSTPAPAPAPAPSPGRVALGLHGESADLPPKAARKGSKLLIAQRDAQVHGSTGIEGLEGLSLILKVNGSSSSSNPSTGRSAPVAAVRRGRPSAYRNPSLIVQDASTVLS